MELMLNSSPALSCNEGSTLTSTNWMHFYWLFPALKVRDRGREETGLCVVGGRERKEGKLWIRPISLSFSTEITFYKSF